MDWLQCYNYGRCQNRGKFKIFPGAVISAIPQDLKFQGEKSLTIIGDNCTIRECATINRGTSASGKTIIGDNCLIMAYAHIAHDCNIGDNCIIVNSVALGGHVSIGNCAIIGGLSAIHQFVSIGVHARFLGFISKKDVPPYVKILENHYHMSELIPLDLEEEVFLMRKFKKFKIYLEFYINKITIIHKLFLR